MNMTKWTVAAVVTVLACGTLAFAAEPASQPASGPMLGQMGNQIEPGDIAPALRELKLTPEQREKVRPILQAHRQALADFRAKNGSEMQSLLQQLNQAHQNKDKAAAEAAEQKLKPILQQREALAQDFMKQLGTVLDAKQMAKLEELVSPGKRFERFVGNVKKLNLTEDQKSQIKQIVKEAKESKEFVPAMRKIMQTLTDEQRAQLRQMREEDGPASQPAGQNLREKVRRHREQATSAPAAD